MIVAVLLACGNLIAAFTAGFGVSALWLLGFDVPLAMKLDKVKIQFRWEQQRRLFKECFPLFLGSFLLIFIMNVSKNGINSYLSDEVQACYSIIFMPSSVINMFSMFVCVPLYGHVAVAWHQKDRGRFLKLMRNMLLYIFALTAVVLLGGYLLGIPVLSWISGLDLREYKSALDGAVGSRRAVRNHHDFELLHHGNAKAESDFIRLCGSGSAGPAFE